MTTPSGFMAQAALDAVRAAASVTQPDLALAPPAPQEATVTDRTPQETLTAAANYVRLVAETNRAICENRTIPVEMRGRTQASVARADMHPTVGAALADWLDAMAVWAREYPEMAHDHDRPACEEYACDVMGSGIAFARQILGEAS
jgi:hypothetical protein